MPYGMPQMPQGAPQMPQGMPQMHSGCGRFSSTGRVDSVGGQQAAPYQDPWAGMSMPYACRIPEQARSQRGMSGMSGMSGVQGQQGSCGAPYGQFPGRY